MLIAVLAIALLVGVVSAATISYFGQVKMTANVTQAVLVDGHSYPYVIGETADVAGGESFCKYHWLTSQTSVPVTLGFYTDYWPEGSGIATTYTTTITESSSYPDYFADSQRLVALQVSGKTLSTLLGMTLEYTVDVVSASPLYPAPGCNNYAPNINIEIKSGSITKTVENWGGFTVLGLNTKTFETLMGESGGATVITGQDTSTRETFTTTSTLLTSYGTWQVTMVEVRAQAGAAGGQVLRPVEFKAAGVTIAVPDYNTFTILTLQPGEFLPFYICYKFDPLIEAGTYDIYTTIKPYP
jgi:hypothetical protein